MSKIQLYPIVFLFCTFYDIHSFPSQISYRRYKEDFDQLYEISIRPVAEGIYPLRPPTPEELVTIKTTVQQKAPAKYVPPHLRNGGGARGSVPGAGSRGSVPGAGSRVNGRTSLNSR